MHWLVQLINTAFAVYEMHQQAGRAREAQRIRAVVENQLAPFTATMPSPYPSEQNSSQQLWQLRHPGPSISPGDTGRYSLK